MEDEEDNTHFHMVYNIHDPMSHYRCQIPELLGKRIRGCFHGCWTVLSSNHPRDVIWSLWNPITSRIINLPPLNHRGSKKERDYIEVCCLSAPPEDPNSVLLLTRKGKRNFVYCRLGIDSLPSDACNRQELRWTESAYANQIKILTDCDGSILCLTCCNGKVYAYIRLSGNRCQLIVEVDIVINDCELVITLLPILKLFAPFIIDCYYISLLLKGSSTEVFLVVEALIHKRKTVGAVKLSKLNMNNMTREEIEYFKDIILSVQHDTDSSIFYSPAIVSSEFGGYIHILADEGKIIYSYRVKDKTISFSSIPCAGPTNHVSAWTMLESTRLGVGLVNVHYTTEKESHKKDVIAIRSLKGNHEDVSHLLKFRNGSLKMKEPCVGVECRLESDKVDDDESHLLNLPLHVLEMLIMEFCAGVDYLKFRATCKRCHLAAPLIPWNNGKASKIMKKYSVTSPWLIVFDKHKDIISLTDPVFGDKYFMKTPQELICDFQIQCSRFGWLLILMPDGSLMFFNPFTREILEIPKLPETYFSYFFSFSAPPNSPDCMVVAIIRDMYWRTRIYVMGGEPSWSRIPLYVTGGNIPPHSVTFYGRDVYVLRPDGGLDLWKEMDKNAHQCVHDVAKPLKICGKSSPRFFFAGRNSSPECFQLTCDRHLLRVIVGKFGELVEVYKLTSSKEWAKVVGLGKHTIFISGISSLCLDAKTPQMENKIYFPSSPIMYYSLETCMFHTLNSENIKESFIDFFRTTHHPNPHEWIEPRWS